MLSLASSGPDSLYNILIGLYLFTESGGGGGSGAVGLVSSWAPAGLSQSRSRPDVQLSGISLKVDQTLPTFIHLRAGARELHVYPTCFSQLRSPHFIHSRSSGVNLTLLCIKQSSGQSPLPLPPPLLCGYVYVPTCVLWLFQRAWAIVAVLESVPATLGHLLCSSALCAHVKHKRIQ